MSRGRLRGELQSRRQFRHADRRQRFALGGQGNGLDLPLSLVFVIRHDLLNRHLVGRLLDELRRQRKIRRAHRALICRFLGLLRQAQIPSRKDIPACGGCLERKCLSLRERTGARNTATLLGATRRGKRINLRPMRIVRHRLHNLLRRQNPIASS